MQFDEMNKLRENPTEEMNSMLYLKYKVKFFFSGFKV